MTELLAERVTELLAALGGTCDEVADTLGAQGIRGDRGNPECCPVARYLTANLPDDPMVYVHVGSADVTLAAPDENVWLMLPSPVQSFTYYFDVERRWPELDDEWHHYGGLAS